MTASTEDQARAYLESLRWPDGPVCPFCQAMKPYPLRSRSQGGTRRPGVYCCRACRRQFTVTVGTPLHRTRLPLRKWVLAYRLFQSADKIPTYRLLMQTTGISMPAACRLRRIILSSFL